MPIFSQFGADFFTVGADFSRFIRDINGEKKISLLMIVFSRLVFHGLPPLDHWRMTKKRAIKDTLIVTEQQKHPELSAYELFWPSIFALFDCCHSPAAI